MTNHKHRFEMIQDPSSGETRPVCINCGKVEKPIDPCKEVKRQVRIAASLGSTVPYDLRTLIDCGIGIDTIRKVIRSE